MDEPSDRDQGRVWAGADVTTRNTIVSAPTSGVVQAGTISGGVHYHSAAMSASPVPRQLRAVPRGFVGRADQLAGLDEASAVIEHTAPAAAISVVSGTGGIGKTWLALTWAHRNLRRFPDGQLFADLNGFAPTGRPTHPADVLGGFLEALGVDRDRQPTDPARRAELYRSLVADKRVLVVLDNAATTDQVSPLLPGGPGCAVVVTSRDHLRGLVARHGARSVNLNVLSSAEAETLLRTALGADRVAAAARAVTELVALCGGFPLALGLVAARAAAEPALPMSDIVTELHTFGLDALDSDDPVASLPSVLSWSLHQLTDLQRETFALFGVAPGPDISLGAAAALIGLSDPDTRTTLQALTDASLVARAPGGRYAMHDLVRAYAITTAGELPDEIRESALRRALDFYVHTARIADQLLNPHREQPPLAPPASDVRVHAVPDTPGALAWFDIEHPCLIAAQHTAAVLASHTGVWHLAWALQTFHYRRGHRHDRLAIWQAATAAANHLTDSAAQTHAHRYLGLANADLGQHEDATRHLRRALALAEQHDNPDHQARTHDALARAWERRSDYPQALEHARRALELVRDPVGEARALNTVGWYTARLHDYDTAREFCQAALTAQRSLGNQDGVADTLDSLGYIEHRSGHYSRAVDHYRDAVSLYRHDGNTYQAATTLDALGHSHAALGEVELARTVWREAMDLYEAQGRQDMAAQVRRQIDALDD